MLILITSLEENLELTFLYSANYKIGGNEKVKFQGRLGIKPISGLKGEKEG